ncbi:hypothetical protein [Natranaerofaba carboxydovora]|uniref:hypothetical protein n=1 Tax=Natranaerofaba carboxydovora TaxID=2742683 RepID=UPI001F147657|nr:hypothetical protein [Natranaerofaba carboxydovora]UMZ74648.1 hypothetical protein ACONDI_02247 [Natranaerofaba carboxydovora]
MTQLKTLILIPIFILSIITGWFYLLGMSFETTFLSTSYFEDLTKEVDIIPYIYDNIPYDTMLEDIPENIPGRLPISDNINIFEDKRFQEMVERSFVAAFPKSWTREQSIIVINEFLEFTKEEKQEFDPMISLHTPKENIHNNLVSYLREYTDRYNLERYLNRSVEDIVALTIDEMDIPEEVHLVKINPELSSDIETAATNLQNLRRYYLTLPYIIFGGIFLSFFIFTGLKGAIKGLGASLLISGSSFLFFLFLSRFVFLYSLIEYMAAETKIDQDILLQTAEFTLDNWFSLPIIFSTVGAVLFVAGGILPTKN